MRSIGKHGQSILEYSVLFATVLSALLIMQFYVKRAYEGRLKHEADSLGQQYSPRHTVSRITTTTSSTSVTTTKDGVMRAQIGASSPTITRTERIEAVDSFATEP